VQATRLATPIETLTGSVALTRAEKFQAKPHAFQCFFSRKSPKAARRQSVERRCWIWASVQGSHRVLKVLNLAKLYI